MKTTMQLSPNMTKALKALAEDCKHGHAGSLQALSRRGLVALTYSGGANPYSGKYHVDIDSARMTDAGIVVARELGFHINKWWR